jgi:hypothetical protein
MPQTGSVYSALPLYRKTLLSHLTTLGETRAGTTLTLTARVRRGLLVLTEGGNVARPSVGWGERLGVETALSDGPVFLMPRKGYCGRGSVPE